MADATDSVDSSEVVVDRLLDSVRRTLVDIERDYRARGRSLTDLGLEDLAERMAAVVPSPSSVNEHIGPFYRAEQVARLLGMTRQAVHERTKKGRLLALRTADDVLVYPTLQFHGRHIVERLPEVLVELREADRWAVAAWLVSSTAALGGRRPIDVIHEGENMRAVRDLAQDALRRWEH